MNRLMWRSAVVGCACVGLVSTRAQERPASANPHIRLSPTVPTRQVKIDDMRFDVSEDDEAAASPRSRAQGQTLDSDSLTGNQKFPGWEAGVIPIEFASDFSQARQDQFMRVCNSGWGSAASVSCIPRTSQSGYMHVTSATVDSAGEVVNSCYSNVGQFRRLVRYETHLGPNCTSDKTFYHEMGHAFGFIHEHQRPDRDSYVLIDTTNIDADQLSNFTKRTLVDQPTGTYDFMSIMHYAYNAFAINSSRATIIPRSGYTSFSTTMGTSTAPTSGDRAAINNLYGNYNFRPYTYTNTVANTRFDTNDFLDAMERLHAYYYSRLGLMRPAGLSINGGPDFQGIATWIFDIYLGARSVSFSPDLSFSIVVTDINQSAEWRSKHPTSTPGTRSSFRPAVSFDRSEFLDAMNKLNAFYSAPEGLQRPNGLSISGGPDFLGIANWIFSVYLNERLLGGSSTLAWQRVVDAIRGTDEWKTKHR